MARDKKGLALIAIVVTSVLCICPSRLDAVHADKVLTVPGEYLRAFAIAYDNVVHRNDIPTKSKQLENYDVDIGATDGKLVVVFRPRTAPGEHYGLGGRTSLGVDMIYYLDPRSYRIILITGVR